MIYPRDCGILSNEFRGRILNCNQVLTALNNLGARGMNFGTERARKLLNALGCPDKELKIGHISGSNGKGSVAEYVYRILLAAGKSAG